MRQYVNQRFKEKCDFCQKYSNNFWTSQPEDDGDFVICDECFRKSIQKNKEVKRKCVKKK